MAIDIPMSDLLSFFRAIWRLLTCGLFLLASVHYEALSAPPKKVWTDTAELRKHYFAVRDHPDPDNAILILKNLLPDAEACKDNWLTGDILVKMAEYYMLKGDHAQALACMDQAYPYHSAESLQVRANYYQHIGWIYVDMGDYVAASENYKIAYECYVKLGFNDPGSVNICNDLGEIFFQLHQNEKALYYYNLGEEIAYNNHIEGYLGLILLNKGIYYTSVHKLDSARILYNRVYDMGERANRPDIKAAALKGIGKTFIESGEYSKAEDYLQSAVDLSKNKLKSNWIESSFLLGEVWYRLRKYDQAETLLIATLNEAFASNLKGNMISGYNTLAAVYKATAQYTKALDCMDSVIALKDSFESAERTKAIYLIDVKHQTAKKDKEIADSKLLIARKNTEMAHKNMWILMIGGGTLLLLLLSIWAYFHMLNKKRALEKENKISVLKAAIQGGDDERRRIARELHDGIGGMLSAAMMRFSSMSTDRPDVTTTAGYAEAMGILNEMGDEIRKTAHNLMPEVLVKQSLPEAIRAYCNSVRVNGALQISFQYYGSFDDLSQDCKLNLYRIVQELVKNVIQHAHAKRALVQLMRNEEVLIVCVEDDGKGFDKKEMKPGQGLYNTQTRVSSFDGLFTIESNPGKGTSVFIEFKMHKPGTAEEEKQSSDRAAVLLSNLTHII
ncbi:MAG: signal transduction histidine kinase [Flavipsychrobacter sp.]|jgi:signal transduction histidine kinase|nr:signal transduction histidine kinase [Flavipsychrobacter sp.]